MKEQTGHVPMCCVAVRVIPTRAARRLRLANAVPRIDAALEMHTCVREVIRFPALRQLANAESVTFSRMLCIRRVRCCELHGVDCRKGYRSHLVAGHEFSVSNSTPGRAVRNSPSNGPMLVELVQEI